MRPASLASITESVPGVQRIVFVAIMLAAASLAPSGTRGQQTIAQKSSASVEINVKAEELATLPVSLGRCWQRRRSTTG